MDVIIMNKSKKENIQYVTNSNLSFTEYWGGGHWEVKTLCIKLTYKVRYAKPCGMLMQSCLH